jgi:RNA polymerase sigma-70 factor (ECF subfamily)
VCRLTRTTVGTTTRGEGVPGRRGQRRDLDRAQRVRECLARAELRLEPCPDTLLDGLPDAPRPDARYEVTEAISLAFVTALQLLPPRQRAVLILRDVLGYHAAEGAEILATTLESVTSALKRARASLQRFRTERESGHEAAPAPDSPAERELVSQLVSAYQAGDIDALTSLLTDDVVVAMPPVPFEYHGRELAVRFLAMISFRNGRTYDLLPTRANGQLAFGAYVRDSDGGVRRAEGLRVLTLSGNRIRRMTRFETSLLPRFGLPLSLSGIGPMSG